MTNIRSSRPAATLLVRFLPVLAALVLGSPAHAQNAISVGTPELYPTYAAVGVRVAYTGDANANATGHLEWRPAGATTWTQGVSLTRIQNQRWAGSVMW